ncbi:glycosyltransferase involved in cell wall biosynthesis [Alteromonadaceae bacterium 2753L.S.0a.02]|nr:glycosyltransferase involved in cell wall biosynthesis [Alteromonadaceae bacterium 2753L.S.0a.02]
MKIAYLAPEIPALSATFVYNEILELESNGVAVQGFSIHRPGSLAQDDKLAGIRDSTRYLYERGLVRALLDNFKVLIRNPSGYFGAAMELAGDICRLGLISRNAFGQCMRFVFGASLARDLSACCCEHIHIHFAHVPTDVGMYAAKISGIGYSVTAHANDLFERGYLLKQKVARSRFFGTISEYNRDYLLKLGAIPNKLEITRCGVDARYFSPIYKQSFDFTLGSIGRLVEKKGFDTLVKAVSILCKKGVTCRLKLAGSGPLDDDLRAMVESLGVTDSVEFLGALSHSDVPGYLAGLDVFVLACKTDSQGDMDGIPVVLMEAMLSGLPVVSTRLSGIPELVIDGKTGLLANPGDAEGLAESIENLFSNEQLRSQCVSEAIAHVEAEFSLVTNVNRLQQRFQESIG